MEFETSTPEKKRVIRSPAVADHGGPLSRLTGRLAQHFPSCLFFGLRSPVLFSALCTALLWVQLAKMAARAHASSSIETVE